MKRLIIFLFFILCFFPSSLVSAKNLGHFRGYLQLGKKPIEVSKTNFLTAAHNHQSKSDHQTIRVLTLVDSSFNPNSISQYGWKYLSRINSEIVVLEGPAETAPYLTAIDGILYAKRPLKVFGSADSARRFTHVDEVNGTTPSNLPQAYKGEGVLIGIMETEFDTHHPAFLDSLGNSRFVAIWDQSDSSGPKTSYGYGTIKNSQQIIADSNFAAHGEPHGTLVTGIAAGSVVANNPYYGMASKAELIGVKYSGTDNDLVDGIKWIFSVADSLKMPCVINMSIGSASGPHDGTSLMDKSIDNLSANGKIIVGAAGNDGIKRSHVNFILNKNETKGTWITPEDVQDKTGKPVTTSVIDIWGKSGVYYSLNFYLLNKSTMDYRILQPSISTSITKEYADTLYELDSATHKTDTLIYDIMTERRSPLNNKVHVEAYFLVSNPNLVIGANFINTNSITDTINAWNAYKESFESYDINGYIGGDSTMSINEIGGTAKRNICVGAYRSKSHMIKWDGSVYNQDLEKGVAHFSSHGPTADGRLRPDICAPGIYVVGPMSRLADTTNVVTWPDTATKYGRYTYNAGTSLSAPIVSGIVALMLQAKPTLSPEEAKQILQETAITDDCPEDIPPPSIYWGYGRVNALKAMQTLLGLSSSRVVTNKMQNDITFHLLARGVRVTGNMPSVYPCEASWYSINGKLIKKQILNQDGIINYPQAGRQMYLLKLQMQNVVTTVKLQRQE